MCPKGQAPEARRIKRLLGAVTSTEFYFLVARKIILLIELFENDEYGYFVC